MSRWLVNTFPTWALAVLFIGGFMLFAAGGLALVRRRVPAVGRGEHNEAVTLALELLVGVYGIVLGFVIVTHYEDHAEAEGTVKAEAIALVQLHRDSGAFPAPVRERLRSRIRGYTASVTGHGWRRMREGEESGRTRVEIGGLYQVLQRFAPRGATESEFYSSAVAKLDDLVAARRDRLQHSAHTLPTPFVVLLYVGAFAAIGLLWFFGIPSLRMQTALVTVVAGLVGFNLLLATLLDHPFSGDLAVSTAPYDGVRELESDERARRP